MSPFKFDRNLVLFQLQQFKLIIPRTYFIALDDFKGRNQPFMSDFPLE